MRKIEQHSTTKYEPRPGKVKKVDLIYKKGKDNGFNRNRSHFSILRHEPDGDVAQIVLNVEDYHEFIESSQQEITKALLRLDLSPDHRLPSVMMENLAEDFLWVNQEDQFVRQEQFLAIVKRHEEEHLRQYQSDSLALGWNQFSKYAKKHNKKVVQAYNHGAAEAGLPQVDFGVNSFYQYLMFEKLGSGLVNALESLATIKERMSGSDDEKRLARYLQRQHIATNIVTGKLARDFNTLMTSGEMPADSHLLAAVMVELNDPHLVAKITAGQLSYINLLSRLDRAVDLDRSEADYQQFFDKVDQSRNELSAALADMFEEFVGTPWEAFLPTSYQELAEEKHEKLAEFYQNMTESGWFTPGNSYTFVNDSSDEIKKTYTTTTNEATEVWGFTRDGQRITFRFSTNQDRKLTKVEFAATGYDFVEVNKLDEQNYAMAHDYIEQLRSAFGFFRLEH